MKTWTIGRHADCDLVLDSPLVSRLHAQVQVDDQGALLRDLGSANGTFFEGQRIQEQRIKPDQGFYIANVHLVFDGD